MGDTIEGEPIVEYRYARVYYVTVVDCSCATGDLFECPVKPQCSTVGTMMHDRLDHICDCDDSSRQD